MGKVYQARQIKANRFVALKVIRAGKDADAEEIARFRTEVEAAASLQHPGIIQIFEVGEYDGQPFFSMELCEGGSLANRLAEGPIKPQEAAALVRALAEAMEFRRSTKNYRLRARQRSG
jgi:serine/threonine-protein kinase